ncbi:hypothetical protein [Embleya sp. NPDC059259]|uniref:hypothetical protein n=1 Tax=unclassified Embleya TaxID=2699296 RepID=UPI003675F0B0
METALAHGFDHPDVGGALILRFVPPAHYMAEPRMDLHSPTQLADLHARETRRTEEVPMRVDEADALLRVLLDGGIDDGTGPTVRQHHTLDTLAETRLIHRGPTAETIAPGVAYSLRLMAELPEPTPPTTEKTS